MIAKRFTLFFIAALLTTLSLFAHDFEVNGIYYNKNSDGSSVSVTYRGSNYDSYTNEYSGKVVIPSEVTYNGKTYSVTSIGDNSFMDCSGLTSVTIPNSVTSIDDYAFCCCEGLTSVTIPNSVTSIGDYAFYYCHGLTSIIIPNSVTSIGNYAFLWCYGLTSVTIPNSVTSIGEGAFYWCHLTSVIIGNSVTSIGKDAFYCCDKLTIVEISDIAAWYKIRFVNFASNPLYYAKHLYLNGNEVTNLIIPNSVTSIGDYAFCRCTGLTSITIPNSVTYIGKEAFGYCSGLTKILVLEGNSTFDSRNDCNAIIETSTNTLVVGCKSTTIPNSVNSIGDYAFYGCSGLTSVTIPNSVTSIGDYAFNGCSGLTSITIPNSVTSIGDYAFYYCSNLIKSAYPDNLRNPFIDGIKIAYPSDGIIDENGVIFDKNRNTIYFAPMNIRSVTIPNSVTSIGNNAFYGCSNLIKSAYPNHLTNPFESGIAIEYPTDGIIEDNGVIYDKNKNTVYFAPLNISSTVIPNSVNSIGDYAFGYCSELKSIAISPLVENISETAFYDVSAIKTAYPEGLSINIKSRIICKYPADGIMTRDGIAYDSEQTKLYFVPTSFTQFSIPSTVSSIINYAFMYCDNLSTVTIPKSVSKIGSQAFAYCQNLNNINCRAIEPPICLTDAFYEVNKNECILDVPYESLDLYKAADQWKDFLNIGGVEEIGIDESNISIENGKIINSNNENIEVYNLSGIKVYSGNNNEITLDSGIYIVKINNKAIKIAL